MKKQTKILYGALFAALLMATPFAAQARPYGPCFDGNGPERWQQSFPEEKREAVWKLMREHREQIQPLRDRLWAASRTLDALEGNPKVDPKEIRDLVNEMVTLRAQLREQHKAFADKVQKDTGVSIPTGDFSMRQSKHHAPFRKDLDDDRRGYGRRHHERMNHNW